MEENKVLKFTIGDDGKAILDPNGKVEVNFNSTIDKDGVKCGTVNIGLGITAFVTMDDEGKKLISSGFMGNNDTVENQNLLESIVSYF